MTRLRNLGLAIVCAAGFMAPAHSGVDCNFPMKQCLFTDGLGCFKACGVKCCDGTSAGCNFGFGVDAVCTCTICPQLP